MVYFLYHVSFEFDEQKSRISLEKHGIGFVQAQDLWNDPYLIEIPAKTTDEPRSWSLAESKVSTGLRSSHTAAKTSASSLFAGRGLKR